MGNRVKFNLQRRKRFLDNLIALGGNLTAALKSIDYSPTAFYTFKERGIKHIEEGRTHTAHARFVEQYHVAEERGLEALENEARRRAFSGCVKPIYYMGEKIDEEIVYSDKLTTFLLKGGNRKKYGTNVHELSGPDGTPLETKTITTEMSAKEAADFYKQTIKK